jgi:hypothetical protein
LVRLSAMWITNPSHSFCRCCSARCAMVQRGASGSKIGLKIRRPSAAPGRSGPGWFIHSDVGVQNGVSWQTYDSSRLYSIHMAAWGQPTGSNHLPASVILPKSLCRSILLANLPETSQADSYLGAKSDPDMGRDPAETWAGWSRRYPSRVRTWYFCRSLGASFTVILRHPRLGFGWG